MPTIAEEMPRGDQRFFNRGKGVHAPHADQTRVAAASGGPGVFLALDLRGQDDHLDEKNRHQYERVLVSNKKIFHDAALGGPDEDGSGQAPVPLLFTQLKSFSKV